MNDKRRKYAAEVSVPPELLDRDPTFNPIIEKELVCKLTDPVVKEAIKGECIVRFTETEQREDFANDLIKYRKYVYIEEIVRCKDCEYAEHEVYQNSDVWLCRCRKYSQVVEATGFCSYGERRTDEI